MKVRLSCLSFILEQLIVLRKAEVMPNTSEVARLLEGIRLSYEAAHMALHGPAIVGRHEIITKKMEHMQQDHEKLQTIVGAREAIKLVAETLENVEEVRKPQVEPL